MSYLHLRCCENTKDMVMITLVPLIKVGLRGIRNADSVANASTETMSSTHIAETNTRDATSVIGGLEAATRNTMLITMHWRNTSARTTSCALIKNAWIRSLLFLTRKWTSKHTNLKLIPLGYQKMQGEMPDWWTCQHLIIDLLTNQPASVVMVVTVVTVGELAEAVTLILNQFRNRVPSHYGETNLLTSARWLFKVPSQFLQEHLVGNLPLRDLQQLHPLPLPRGLLPQLHPQREQHKIQGYLL